MKRHLLAIAACMPVMAFGQSTTPSVEAIANQVEVLAAESDVSREAFSEQIKNSLNGKGEVVGIQELPLNRVFFVQATDGNYLVTSDGRFVLEGKLTDVWHRKTIDSLEDARQAVRTPLTNLNFDFLSQLPAWTVGNPDIPRQGLVFVDPTSEITQTFLKQIISEQDKYHFVVALLPLVGGSQSVDRARRLMCAKDQQLALIDLANFTNESTGDLRPDCDGDKLVFASLMTEVLRIEKLPHFIREDGFVSPGLPSDLDAWLNHK